MLNNMALILVYGLVPYLDSLSGQPTVRGSGPGALAVSILVAGAASVLLFESVRVKLAGIFRSGAFDPASLPQMTALIFCVYLLGSTILEFVTAGGFSGLAQSFEAPSAGSIVTQDAILVLIAVLGVGFPLRRTRASALERLGLRLPTLEELGIGVLAAAGLVVLAYMTGVVWELFTAPEVIRQQTELSRLISEGVNTMTFALIASAGAAIGEEIAFRGGLQPVFGLLPTAVFFALTHIQYTLTPAALLIVAVGLGLGWLRKRYNTTVAIVTHFSYNFVLFLLPLFARYVQDIMGIAHR
jgi:membrane protease YdiL (CAAX protease family)